MRKEPIIGTADIVIDTANEPYITEDFANIDVCDPREPRLGISFAPATQLAAATEAKAEVAPSTENADTSVAEQNDNNAEPLQPKV